MTAIKAYYDGTTFIPLQHYPFHRHQQVIIVVDDSKKTKESPIDQFLKLKWEGDETADEILTNIYENRVNKSWNGEENELFD